MLASLHGLATELAVAKLTRDGLERLRQLNRGYVVALSEGARRTPTRPTTTSTRSSPR